MTSNLSPNSQVDVSVVDRNIENLQSHQWRKMRSSPWARVVQGVSPVPTTTDDVPLLSSSTTAQSSSNVVPEITFSSNDVSSETVSAEISNSEGNSSDRDNGDAAVLRKPAWNKPSNGGGVVESSSVMGGTASWPALSESTKPTPKSSSDVLKSSSDGSASTSQAPIVSETSQLQVNSNANANSTPNHGLPRQRSMRRGGGGLSNGPSGGLAQVGNISPPPPPPLPPSFPAMGLLPPYGTFVAPILDTPPPPVRGVRPMGGLRPHSGGDQSSQPQRNPSRRNGFGARPRGDGPHNHNNGGRRDSDRVPHQFIPPGPYIPPPPPPGSASFITPPNMRPFMTPMGYDMTSPYMIVPTLGPEPFRGMPFIPQPPPAPMFYPTADMHLPNMIVKQIDYYFSDANLVRDNYLRSNMDEEGWVPIDLIANFPRVQQMTTDIQMILESLRTSTVVEVQGKKIRRREDWEKWVHRSSRASADSGSQPPPAVVPPSDSLSASIQQMSLNVGSTRGSEDTVDSQ